MDKTARQLQHRVLSVIGRGVSRPTTDEEFNALALELFAFQFARNEAYRAYAISRGATPASVSHWRAIPATPTSVFKSLPVTCFDPGEAVAEFHTSGTTTAQAGKHYFPTLALYDAALAPPFAAWCLPDHARLPMLLLAPAPTEAPRSSLSYMLGRVAARFATETTWFVKAGELALAPLVARLEQVAATREPVFLLGTAFAFAHLLEHCAAPRRGFGLAAGSRVLETGGFKGRSRALPRPEFYQALTDRLGIPASHIVNEYGMTELSSQFYDDSLATGQPGARKRVPPWARVTVIDPRTGQPAAAGEAGLLQVVDLANLGSSICVQTEDLGVATDTGFAALGRAAGAAARGCSLTAEDLLVTA